jgi:hypothetical protein
MSRFITVPIGQLEHLGAVVFGIGLGCNLTATSFLRGREPREIIEIGFAIMFAGAARRTVDWFRRKRLSNSAQHL